jgi:four helix bundle protein
VLESPDGARNLKASSQQIRRRIAMGEYRKLKVWGRAHQLTIGVYTATRSFPKDELYGLTSQTRRAAVSIPANIAEGYGRGGDTELARFLTIAIGSANELDYHLLLARDLGYFQTDEYDHLAAETQGVARMLSSFISRIREPANGQEPTANSQQPTANGQERGATHG